MITTASMTKEVPATGTILSSTHNLFKRHKKIHPLKGIATFDSDQNPSILLEVADTPEASQRGLMGRDEISVAYGMIFTNISPYGCFWMKGCKIPLDIIFI